MDSAFNEQKNIKSCLTDKPLTSHEEDNLRATDYAEALSQFIIHADTPVTIGIQGGWGSGKTSLISVLRENLEKQTPPAALCVMVNAWEHSLFHGSDNKAEVALSLLKGLTDGLKRSVLERQISLDPGVLKAIGEKSNAVDLALKGIKTGVLVAGKIGVQMLANMVSGGNINNIKLNANHQSDEEFPSLAENVHKLKINLEAMVKRVTYNGQTLKIVFFIDDLDRISPPTAIDILDITKNIFNIADCVFVLAIDYEVVVKGLEDKFGPKSIDNEREFRQYFDKIIQIPFTMPVGAYSDKLVDMLRLALEQLGNNVGTVDNILLDRLAEDARIATGGIPRSIKRIINTLSLLQHIANAQQKKLIPNSEISFLENLEARFILVALHINYPEICKRLMEKPNFTEWKIDELNLAWKLNFKNNRENLELLEKDEFFNDEWEKVVYCLSSQSTWLKSQAKNISRLLNNLLLALDPSNRPDEKLSDESLQTFTNMLSSIRVVSIDSESDGSVQFDDKSVKTDRVTIFFQKLQDELSNILPDNIMPGHTKEWAKRGELRTYEINMNSNVFQKTLLEYDKSQKTLYITIEATRHGVKKADAEDILEKFSDEYTPQNNARNFAYFYEMNMPWDNFIDAKGKVNLKIIKELCENTLLLYKAVDKTQKKFAQMKK